MGPGEGIGENPLGKSIVIGPLERDSRRDSLDNDVIMEHQNEKRGRGLSCLFALEFALPELHSIDDTLHSFQRRATRVIKTHTDLHTDVPFHNHGRDIIAFACPEPFFNRIIYSNHECKFHYPYWDQMGLGEFKTAVRAAKDWGSLGFSASQNQRYFSGVPTWIVVFGVCIWSLPT